MKSYFLLFILLPLPLNAGCNIYYFGLDFGSSARDGHKIIDYLKMEKVPFTIFVVGNSIKSPEGKRICEKIRNSSSELISLGNHTKSHIEFKTSDNEAYIRQEILGNEPLIQECDRKKMVKYFRYPKGIFHPLVEKVLLEAGYSSKYETIFNHVVLRPTRGIWWTTDTRDWIGPNSASNWAQIDYFNSKGKLLSVDHISWQRLLKMVYSDKFKPSFVKKIKKHLKHVGTNYPTFATFEHVSNFHGPLVEDIYQKVINDNGIVGQDRKKHCFPLMHLGGHSTLEALTKIIPYLRKQQREFRAL